MLLKLLISFKMLLSLVVEGFLCIINLFLKFFLLLNQHSYFFLPIFIEKLQSFIFFFHTLMPCFQMLKISPEIIDFLLQLTDIFKPTQLITHHNSITNFLYFLVRPLEGILQMIDFFVSLFELHLELSNFFLKFLVFNHAGFTLGLPPTGHN